jgi:hypothetical protein
LWYPKPIKAARENTSQSLPPAGGKKLKSFFHRDMRVGKNISQAANVKF